MKLDLRQLRHVLALDRYRSFGRAAEAIGITQPALSRSVQTMEGELGARLFDRDRNRVVPTAVGQRLVELAARTHHAGRPRGTGVAADDRPGNFVGRGEPTLLTRISQVDPIHVRFSVPESEFLRIQRSMEGLTREQRMARGRGAFEMSFSDGSVYPPKGSFVFGDRQVDPTTGALLVEVAFPNPTKQVRPGQFARIKDAADLLLALLNQVLDLSRAEAGKIELERTPFSLEAMLARVRSVTAPAAEAKALALQMQLDAETPRALVGDPTRIAQVLLNLLGNAVKFTAQGAQINKHLK